MAVDPASIKFYQCTTWAEGATHGGDINLAAEITSEVDQNIFDDVTDAERVAGDTEYRKIFIRNENVDSWLAVKNWIDTFTPAANDEISVVLGTNADVQTDAEGYTFVSPNSKTHADVLLVGDLIQNAYKAVWIKRIVTAAGAGYTANNFKLAFESS